MGLTSLRDSQEDELDDEGEVRGGVGGAQVGQLPGHEKVAGGLALVHLPRTVLAGLWRERKEEKCNTCSGELMHIVQCAYIYMYVLYMY